MGMTAMARNDDKEVTHTVDVSLAVMGFRVFVEPEEPVENVCS